MDKVVSEVLSSENISDAHYYIAVIDGFDCRTLKSFLKEIGRAFNFPPYYGQNLNALNDCLNDLEWLDKPNYILIIKNSKEFLRKDPEEMWSHIFHFWKECLSNGLLFHTMRGKIYIGRKLILRLN